MTEPSEATPAATAAEPDASSAADEKIRDGVIEVLRSVFDPEIPVNIYELGLVYDVEVRPEGRVYIRMTLTSPMCPVAETLPPEVQEKARGVAGVADVEIDLVWDPPWNPSMMTEAARLELGM
jgi:FeS assembly SUF system protein